MATLILAIVFSTLTHLMFKTIARFHCRLLTAIVANYLVCVAIGCIAWFPSHNLIDIIQSPWYPISIVQGAMLMICFFLIGRTTQKHGVASASLASRLAVVIPTTAAFFLYDDQITLLKSAGIIAAIVSLYLSSQSSIHPNPHPGRNNPVVKLPGLLFLAFGLHATLIKAVQHHFLDPDSYHIYVTSSFSAAFLISLSIWVRNLAGKKLLFKWKDFALGLLLGCTNYAGVYYLFRALGIPGWQSSQIFPTISIAVVGLSALGAYAIFKEYLDRTMLKALAIGAISIGLINV